MVFLRGLMSGMKSHLKLENVKWCKHVMNVKGASMMEIYEYFIEKWPQLDKYMPPDFDIKEIDRTWFLHVSRGLIIDV